MAGSTKVTLNLEEDDDFREYIRGQIAKAVQLVMRDELQGIVTSELAKLRLTDPENMPISALVNNVVAAHFRKPEMIKMVADTVRQTAVDLTRTELRPNIEAFKQQLALSIRNNLGLP